MTMRSKQAELSDWLTRLSVPGSLPLQTSLFESQADQVDQTRQAAPAGHPLTAEPVAAAASSSVSVRGAVDTTPAKPARRARSADEVEAQDDARIKRMMALRDQADAIAQEDAWRAGKVGFITSSLIQLTFPHSEPAEGTPIWGRTSGSRSLIIQPGYYLAPAERPGGQPTPKCLGYPYGSVPRLVMAWIGREVKIRKSRTLMPGASLAEFMRTLGYTNTSGGSHGSTQTVRSQIRRLFTARIALVDDPNCVDWSNQGFQFADRVQTWWAAGASASQAGLYDSEIELSQQFFDEIQRSPVPLDMRALATLRKSPLALDIYCWLTYRASFIRHPAPVPWESLQVQFGSGIASTAKFKQRFLEELKKVKEVYPGAKFDVDSQRKHFIFLPSPTHVARQRD